MTSPAPYITWYDRPDENIRLYNHYGCDGHGARWIVPLDDCAEPKAGDTRECTNCYVVLPLKHDALHEPAADDRSTVPGAMAVTKRRELPSGCVIEFEHAPAGWLTKKGEPRFQDWRAYYLTRGDEKRRRVESVSTICAAILPKDGLPVWSERAGIRGAVEALERRLIWSGIDPDEAVRIVRANKLGADAARDEAADRGLNVHAILETYMLTGTAPNPADHPDAHRPFIQGLVRWLIAADPEPEAVELLVADPQRGYAGRLDLLARIDGKLTLVDLKTQDRGSIYESAHVQARLYWEAETRHGEHEIEQARVVVVDGRGGFNEMELLADPELARHALDYYLRVKPLCSACDGRNRIIRQALAETA